MIYYFGQASKYYFYAVKPDTGKEIKLTGSSLVNAFLFDKMPSLTEAMNGTGALETITSWATTSDGYGKVLTIPRVEEPSPTQEHESSSYYLAINVKLENTSDALAPIIRELKYIRLRAQESLIMVTPDDLVKICPAVKMFLCKNELDVYVDNAIEEVRRRLNTFDRPFSEIANPSILNYAAAYRALSNFFFNESRGAGSMEYIQYEHFKQMYEAEWKTIQIEVRANNNASKGKIDGAKPSYFSSIRFES